MAVDQEIPAGCVFVLANPGLHKDSFGHFGKAFLQETAGFGDTFGSYAAVASIGIEGGAVKVEGNFEAAGVEFGDAVGAARIGEVDPRREGGCAEASVAFDPDT